MSESDEIQVTSFSKLKAEKFQKWQHMDCPHCGARNVPPYGGFGDHPDWQNVGKYGCYKGCGYTWYADPKTGQKYERDLHGRLKLAS